MRRKLVLFLFLSIFLMAAGINQSASAEGKNPCSSGKHANPCAANPCSVKNPCGMKNPCAARNPCASAPKKIRKQAFKEEGALMKAADALWSSPKLGTSGASCATCHPAGKGLKAEPFPRHIKMAGDILTLDQMINFCMTNPMKGKPLQWNSREMTALAAYVKSHARESAGEVNSCGLNPCGMKNPCAHKNPCGMKNPCAVKNPCGMR